MSREAWYSVAFGAMVTVLAGLVANVFVAVACGVVGMLVFAAWLTWRRA